MTKPSLPPTESPTRLRRTTRLWLVLHLAMLVLTAVSALFLRGGIRVNTNLVDILPGSNALRQVAAAQKALTDRNSRGVYLLASAPDFATARAAAAALYDACVADTTRFESLSLYVDADVVRQCIDYLHRYRYVLLDDDTRTLLENGGADTLAADALAAAYGAFTVTGLAHVDTDPFFLTERALQSFLSSTLNTGGTLSLHDDVLAAEYDGVWYVLLRGMLTPIGAAVNNRQSAVRQLYAASDAVTREQTQVHFVYSGVPFHSYESSSNAQREIALISTVSLALIVLLLCTAFRSPVPVLASFAAIAVSLATAAQAVLLVFGEIHLLTFVFGTAVIGTCVDYSLHFFVHNGDGHALNPRGIVSSFISTEICYAVLLLAPFVILRQFAVFALFGMASSFLSVRCVYPTLRFSHTVTERAEVHRPRLVYLPVRISPTRRRQILAALFVALAVTLALCRNNLAVRNNLGDLYRMSESLMRSEKTAAAVLNYGSAPWYFIVAGDTADDVLSHELRLRERLGWDDVLATTRLVPTAAQQAASYEAAARLLPLADSQLAALGFPPATADVFRADFAAAAGETTVPLVTTPPFLNDVLANLYLGNIGGRSYSCVLPLHADSALEQRGRALASQMDDVFLVSMASDLSAELDSLTRSMLYLFAAAFVLIGAAVHLAYPRRDAWRINAAAAFAVLATVTALALCRIPLGFFSVVGSILVFGLGLDYVFYLSARSRGDGGKTGLAVLLSFATTELSFGALALSSFAPVHLFGVTVFAGLAAAGIAAFLLTDTTAST